MTFTKFPIPTVNADFLLDQITNAVNATSADSAQTGVDRIATSVSASIAQEARNEAEIFARNAAISVKFYDSISSGLAAVSDGATFGVTANGSNGLTYPTLYRRTTSSTQTLIAELILADKKADGAPDVETMSGTAIMVDSANQPVMISLPDGLDFVPSRNLKDRVLTGFSGAETVTGEVLIEDASGGVVLAATNTGLNFIPSIETRIALNGAIPGTPINTILPQMLGDGRLRVRRITEAGLIDTIEQPPFKVEPVLLTDVATPVWVYPGPLDLLLITGQSLVGGARYTTEEQSADQIVSLRGDGLSYHWTGIAGYISWTAPFGDTVASGEIDYIVAGDFDRFEADLPQATPGLFIGDTINRHRSLVGAPRHTQMTIGIHNPGTDIDRLDNDPTTGPETTTRNWTNITYALPRMKAHADANGYDLTNRWHLFDHGTADRFSTEGQYYPKLVEYLADLDALYVSNGLTPPRHIITQAGGFPYSGETGYNHPWCVKEDQLRTAQEGRAILACPQYPWMTGADKVHPTAVSVAFWAESVARAMAEVEAGRPWTCLAPRLVEKTAGQIVLEFDTRPDEALAFNAQKYTAGCTNYGFEVVGALTTMTPPGFSTAGQVRAPIPISSVKITARNRITIACNTTAAVQVKYAMQTQDMSANTDPYTSHRGLLRTDYGWDSTYYPGTTIFRWVPGFRVTL